jgi:hypothetical protein
MTRANLGLVYAEMHRWDDAIQSWHDAAGVASASGALQAAEQYRGWIREAKEALAADAEDQNSETR